jgi:hypothetical protein
MGASTVREIHMRLLLGQGGLTATREDVSNEKEKKSPHMLMFGARERVTDEERVLVARKYDGNTHPLALKVGVGEFRVTRRTTHHTVPVNPAQG